MTKQNDPYMLDTNTEYGCDTGTAAGIAFMVVGLAVACIAATFLTIAIIAPLLQLLGGAR